MTNQPPTMRTYGWYAIELTARPNEHTDAPLSLEEVDHAMLAEQLREMADILTEGA